jgi:hypothetical protein
MANEPVLNLGEDAAVEKAFVQKATDPVLTYTSSPADFAAQYPTPLDVTEILDLCEEISLWRSLPEQRTQLQAYLWREMSSLAYTGSSADIAFADGACPEGYSHDGDNRTITLKNIGAKKTLSISDIMHSAAIAGAGWNGINTLVGPNPASAGMPGGMDQGTFARQHVADVKEKEVRLGMTLVMNGWDRLLVAGDSTTNALEFSGIEKYASGTACSMHLNVNTASGTFSAATFDSFLRKVCKPTHLLALLLLCEECLLPTRFPGSQVVNFWLLLLPDPGYNLQDRSILVLVCCKLSQTTTSAEMRLVRRPSRQIFGRCE